AHVLPATVFVPRHTAPRQLLDMMGEAGLRFPVIAKPDVGERGFLVKKIHDEDQLHLHRTQYPVDFILQEYLTEPVEMSVLFYRVPGEKADFGITSVCRKEFLTVRGDGRQNIRSLMRRHDRAALQLSRFELEKPDLLNEIPADGELRLLENIGNHCKGTKFCNANHLIDETLTAAFEPLCTRLEGVYYGRFDLKCADEEALRRGEVKVMELNGILSDPAHVFDPDHGIWRAYRDYYRHWRIISRISRANRRLGIRDATLKEAIDLWKAYQAAKQPGG
ncbi:MAG TPA: hypothetical protein PKH43_01325, partial [Saprospiraceae bacterium]|nr:hypothetical protein [Saprospiraceae bacterium]